MTSQPKLIALRGYPGSGKTTLGLALQEAGAGRFIDHNKLLNVIAGMAGDDTGLYDAIHDFEIQMTEKVLKDGQSVIIGRGFTRKDQLIPYQKLAKAINMPFRVVRLEAPLEELQRRVASENRQQDTHSVKDPEILAKWIQNHPMESFKGEVVMSSQKGAKVLIDEILAA